MEKRDKIYALLQKLPKNQLHLHLDGSLSFEFIKRSFERMEDDRKKQLCDGKWNPTSADDLRDFIMDMRAGLVKTGMVMKPCANWEVFDFCNNFLQTSEDLSDATCDLATRLYREHHVNYIEVRFAPVLHLLCGLSMNEVVEAVVKGFENAQKLHPDIYGGIILCALRSHSAKEAEKLLPIIKSFEKVIGFDLAGDERSYPLHLFEDVVRECKQQKINTTLHAGEWFTALDNVILAVDLQANRIGHGIALKSATEDFFKKIRERKISIEINLTENCANPLVGATFENHPLPLMLEKDIQIAGLSCDNLLISGSKESGPPDPTVECCKALLDCKLTPQQLHDVIMGGYDAGFHEKAETARQVFEACWKKDILPSLIEILALSYS